MKFRHAIVKKPGKSLIKGLTTANLGIPNYGKALEQHQAYIHTLEECGLQVHVLAAEEAYPDSVFVEDTALLTPHCAILTNPGAPSRRGETQGLKPVLEKFFDVVEVIQAPGTVEAGDIMMVGPHFYIGLSERTNAHGAEQVIDVLEKYGLSGSLVELSKVLHLKTGVAYLEHNTFLACGELLTHPIFQHFKILAIDEDESYAANCIWINDRVLVPHGYPKARDTIEQAGYDTLPVDVSEFRKLDGGLSCLSLRF
ncbi:MAG: arginine deiminase family protein [Anaerolineales bacterium]|nr:arginine deiminase family protein [Anaerolineales bacterium]